jgi:acyl-CoA synthetase (AMP-forming)/AMP-acid ligase II
MIPRLHASSGERLPIAAFFNALDRRPDAIAVVYVDPGGGAHRLTYSDIYREVARAAGGLADQGFCRGSVLPILLPTTPTCLGVYLAALATGVVPVLLPAPRGVGGRAVGERLTWLLRETGARRVVVDEPGANVLGTTFADAILLVEGLVSCPPTDVCPIIDANDVAHLQPTSGTTGSPRLAVIRHSHIAANAQGIGIRIAVRPTDRVVSWLPLYHDMGLICLSCVWQWGCSLVLTDPGNFVCHPINGWLRLISDHGGTISAAPTSAYQACIRVARRRPPASLDLSGWRVGFCGAEPVPAQVMSDFHATFGPSGLAANSILPVYGLAEATLAVTIPNLGTHASFDRVGANPLAEGVAEPERVAGSERRLVAVGRPLPGHMIRIAGPNGVPLTERRVGEIQALGPSVIGEYWGCPPSGAGLFTPDGYLRTGDLGYLADGQLYVVGRAKDVIIIAGRNLIPTQIEEIVTSELEPFGPVAVAALGLPSAEAASEELHLLIECGRHRADWTGLEERIRASVRGYFGVGVANVVWVGRGDLPRTSSGKIQKHACRSLIGSTRIGRASIPKG